jgi:transcription elongation GreA/GreB family factor
LPPANQYAGREKPSPQKETKMKTNISYFDLSNCRIQARVESMKTGKKVTYSDVLKRELNKAKRNEKSLISIHFPALEMEEKPAELKHCNIGKTIIVEHENSNISRYSLVLNSNEIKPELNIVSTRSTIGKALRNAKVDDVVIVSDQLWRIIDIIDKNKKV